MTTTQWIETLTMLLVAITTGAGVWVFVIGLEKIERINRQNDDLFL